MDYNITHQRHIFSCALPEYTLDGEKSANELLKTEKKWVNLERHISDK